MRKSIISVLSAFSVMLVLILSSCENLLLIDEVQLYEVSFETNGGTQIEPFRSCKIEKAPETQKSDATFCGWFCSADFTGEPVSFPYEPTEDTTFYAKWTQKYAVHFATNGGSEIAAYKTDVITSSPDTTRDGYYFVGWYESSDFGGEQIQFPYYLSESTTLYAKWIKICHVQFETNGGSEVTALDTAIINVSPESTRTGYVLLGWYKESELQNQISFPYVLTSDSTFYAKWIANTDTIYKVEHYKQNTALESNLESYVYVESENLAGKTDSLTQAVPKTYEGFIADSYSQTKIAADGTSVVRIYYNRRKYTVSFDSNGGTGETFIQEFYYGCPQQLTENSFSNTGYVFVGWSSSASGDVEYSNQSEFETSCDITLYAVWKEPKTVTYKVQHYKQTTSLGNNYELVSGDTQNLSGKTGELTQATAKAYTGFTAKTFSQVTINESGNSVVKIYYDRKKYIVSFNANSAEGTMRSQIFYYGVCQAIKTNSFEKSGYTFNGWATTSNGQSVYGNMETISVDCDLTLYAQWYYGITATASTVEDLDLSNLTEAFTVKVTGNISQATLVSLASKIAKSNIEITLDLSETQGLVTISPASSNTSVFKDCKKLVSVVFPSSLTTIGSYAFYNCDGLREISILGNIKTIGTYAFNNCDALESVEIIGTETIGDSAFYSCKKLKSIYLKDVGTMGTYAFGNCQSLQNVYLESIKTVGDYSFGYSSNGDYTSNNKMLDSVVLSNITTIGRYAFGYAIDLTLIEMKNITTIREFAFIGCSALSAVNIDAVTVEKGAFESCTSLTAVTIGKRVKELLNYENTNDYHRVFQSCNVLTSVTFENTIGWNYKYSETSYSPIDVSNAATNVTRLRYCSTPWCRL